MFPNPDFSQAALIEAKKHAVECFPKESCGLIVSGEYVACENVAETPEQDFRIDPSHIIASGNNLQAVIHSHPLPFAAAPSASDMQAQIDSACIFGIISCNKNEAYEPIFWGDFLLEEEYGTNGKPRGLGPDGKPREALIGRNFIPGASDCYTLIRAWYWQNKKIYLPEFPRDDVWWKKNGDLYRQGFSKAGFREITMREAQPGDVVLGQIRSAYPNHGGIILDHSLVLHHVGELGGSQLSCRAPIGRYLRYITHWLRHESSP